MDGKLKDMAPEGAVVLNGLDKCCIGHTDTSLIYSYTKLVNHFIEELRGNGQHEDEDQLHTDAVDWVQYNIVNCYVGGSGQFIIMYDFL